LNVFLQKKESIIYEICKLISIFVVLKVDQSFRRHNNGFSVMDNIYFLNMFIKL